MQTARSWETSLGAIESAVGDCLKALDDYEASFRTAYIESGGPVEALRLHIPLDTVEDAWDRQLAGADRSADDVEQLLAEQEIVWNRWQELLATWRHSLEQPPELESETDHAFFRRDPPGRRTI